MPAHDYETAINTSLLQRRTVYRDDLLGKEAAASRRRKRHLFELLCPPLRLWSSSTNDSQAALHQSFQHVSIVPLCPCILFPYASSPLCNVPRRRLFTLACACLLRFLAQFCIHILSLLHHGIALKRVFKQVCTLLCAVLCYTGEHSRGLEGNTGQLGNCQLSAVCVSLVSYKAES